MLCGLCISIGTAFIVWVSIFLYTGKPWRLYYYDRLSVASFYYQRGNYFFGGETYDIDRAQESYERALTFSNVHQEPIHYQLGRVYFIKGKLDAALVQFDAQLVADPAFTKSYYMRGLTYGYLGNYARAEEDFKSYLLHNPQSWAARNDLVWVYFLSGNFAEAEALAREGLNIVPGNAWLSNALGALLISQERYEEARGYLETARKAFVAIGPEGWGVAYPGNDPRIYEQGYQETLASVDQNLELITAKLQGE